MTEPLPPRARSVDRDLEPRSTPPGPEEPAPRSTERVDAEGRTWQAGGSDPTTPAVELDPDRLAAMLPRSRRH